MLEYRALGELYLQHARRQIVSLREALDRRRKVRTLQLYRRDVHGYRYGRPPHLTPARGIAHHSFQHEFADRHDQAGFLGHADEPARRHEAMHRMFPAHQRFEAHHTVRFDVDDRLIVHVELLLLDGGAQTRFDGNALFQLLVHDRAEELEVVPASIL